MAKIIVKDQKNQRRRFAFTHKEAFFYFYRYNSPSFHNKLLSIDHDDTTITTITIQQQQQTVTATFASNISSIATKNY